MIVLEGFDPKMLVSANRRIHHMKRAEVCRYWRGVGIRGGVRVEPVERARIIIHFRFPTNRKRDTPNLYSYVAKPLVDGLVDAGALVHGDDDRWIVGPDIRRSYPNGPHQISIEIERLP